MSHAIEVKGLGKRYRLGETPRAYSTLTETISHLWRRAPRSPRGHHWALKDVSFAVEPGQVVGVIGGNGAGKTTLLKLVSRITDPTEGEIVLRGRVGSLLEVGAGFHPELTGRENIYLNGVMLGMSRHEVERRFEEIVAFADVEKFLDTPVKHYSSGMYVRLAFSVAAHLEPDILLVDEVLAVGDLAFQRKCLGKMKETSEAGRTVLVVSHNMATISGLCERAILLEGGRLQAEGKTRDVVRRYLSARSASTKDLRERADRKTTGDARITSFSVRDADGRPVDKVCTGDEISFWLEYEAERSLPDLSVVVMIKNDQGAPLMAFWNWLVGKDFEDPPRKGFVVCRVPRIPLVSDQYLIDLTIGTRGAIWDEVSAGTLYVVEGDFFGHGRTLLRHKHGNFITDQAWELREGP